MGTGAPVATAAAGAPSLEDSLMRYVSTRGGVEPRSFSDILIGGLAVDGGLVVPERYPRVAPGRLQSWQGLSYPELAAEILCQFMDDIPAADLRGLIASAYSPQVFAHPEIVPVEPLEQDLFLLGLSYGPTLAFKDVAMQLLGQLFEYVLERRDSRLNILGATSGDTGSSAEHAMLGKERINVFMLSPDGVMTPFQRAQMYCLDAPNIFNLAVRGMFDDCQDIVKELGADGAFKERYHLGAVNSINWARVAAQVVYYFKAYLAVVDRVGDPVSFSVPSGNFGNVCAGHIARSMGLPVHRLIVATNENDVLDEFFRSGVYRPRPSAQVHRTSSPSMDISKASNLERFIYDLVGRDPVRLNRLWRSLAEQGCFDLGAEGLLERLRSSGFVSGCSSHGDRLQTIKQVYERFGRVIDPHTADGVKVGLEYREPGVPLICLETALPAKFEETLRQALGWVPERPERFRGLEDLPQHVSVIDADVAEVRRFVAEHALTH